MFSLKEKKRICRHQRIRKALQGTPDQPRLCVHRSLKHMYAQIIDDTRGKILFSLSTLDKRLRSQLKKGGDIHAASLLGEALASRAAGQGVKKVSFDRGGYLYHGRVRAFAEAARKSGLEF